jgi:hypothetical protein
MKTRIHILALIAVIATISFTSRLDAGLLDGINPFDPANGDGFYINESKGKTIIVRDDPNPLEKKRWVEIEFDAMMDLAGPNKKSMAKPYVVLIGEMGGGTYTLRWNYPNFQYSAGSLKRQDFEIISQNTPKYDNEPEINVCNGTLIWRLPLPFGTYKLWTYGQKATYAETGKITTVVGGNISYKDCNMPTL